MTASTIYTGGLMTYDTHPRDFFDGILGQQLTQQQPEHERDYAASAMSQAWAVESGWDVAAHRRPFGAELASVDWAGLALILGTAVLSAALLGYGLLLVLYAGVPVELAAQGTGALVLAGLALSLLLHVTFRFLERRHAGAGA